MIAAESAFAAQHTNEWNEATGILKVAESELKTNVKQMCNNKQTQSHAKMLQVCIEKLAKAKLVFDKLDLPHLHGTKIFKFNDDDLVPTLVSALRKMSNTFIVDTNQLLKFDFCFRCIERTDHNGGWDKETREKLPTGTQLSYKQTIGDKIYLLRDYGISGDGHVWLAVDGNGHLGVLKSLMPPEHSPNLSMHDAAKREAKLWMDIWGIRVPHIRMSNEKHTLAMPFVFHYTSDESPVTSANNQTETETETVIDPTSSSSSPVSPSTFRSVEVSSLPSAPHEKAHHPDHWSDYQRRSWASLQGAASTFQMQVNIERIDAHIASANPEQVAREAIASMASKGYRHDDMKWRHVAFRLDDEGIQRQAILIDLSRVTYIGTSREAKQHAEDDMLQQLGLQPQKSER
jgi:hypothetical protein